MRLLVMTVLAALTTMPAAAQTTSAAGRWDLTINTPEGANAAVLVLKKDGDKLSGTIAGSPGEFAIEGTQQGAEVRLAFTLPRPDGAMQITLSGTQQGDKIAGSARFGPEAEGDWTGARTSGGSAGQPGGSQGQTSGTVDISGPWVFEVQSAAGTGTPTVTFTQSGEKLTGQYAGQLGESPITGTIKGAEFTFAFDVDVQGTALHVVYVGTAAKDALKGTVTLGEIGEGTFTAKRK